MPCFIIYTGTCPKGLLDTICSRSYMPLQSDQIEYDFQQLANSMTIRPLCMHFLLSYEPCYADARGYPILFLRDSPK